MVEYKWQLYAKAGDLFTHVGENLGKNLVSNGTLETWEGMNTSDYIQMSDDFVKVKTNAQRMAFYNNTKSLITSTFSFPANIPEGTAYIRVSASVAVWEGVFVEAWGNRVDVHPIFDQKLAIKAAYENDSMAFRKKLNGKLTFNLADYSWIMAQDFENEIRTVLMKSVDGGQYEDYWEGSFFRTNCTIDEDHRKIEVSPEVADDYTRIMAGLEHEHNLIDLHPEIEHLKYLQFPMCQLYVWGDKCVTNVVAGMYWNEDCDEVNNKGSMRTLNFGKVRNIGVMQVKTEQGSGYYYGTLPDTMSYSRNLQKIATLICQDNGWSVEYYAWYYYDSGTDEGYWDITIYHDIYILRNADGQEVWRTEQQSGSKGENSIVYKDTLSNSYFDFSKSEVYARFLTTKVIDGQTGPIRDDDPFYSKADGNYTRVSYVEGMKIEISPRYSQNPTKWGRVDQEIEEKRGVRLYFDTPDDVSGWIPVGQSKWVGLSYWLEADDTRYLSGETGLINEVILKDSFPLWSCIEKLAQKSDPEVTFKNTSAYSQFFYGSGKYLNYNEDVFNVKPAEIMITQITNVLHGEYEVAALRGNMSLKMILDLLRSCFDCYWFIDDQKRLRIEHVSYFKNGGRYSGSPVVGLNMFAQKNLRNNKTWQFMTHEYSFEKETMAARYEYEWANGATDIFNGNPIDIRSRFVQDDKKESVSASNFVADLSYMIASPSSFSDEGWAVMACEKVSSSSTFYYRVVVDKMNTGVYDKAFHQVQNGFLSFARLQPRFLTYDMPAWNIRINDKNVKANGISRKKKQEITIPVGNSEIDPLKLVKTSVGDGQVYEFELNLSARSVKLTLRYDTIKQ